MAMTETRLVSFLGIGNYSTTKYFLNNEPSAETPYVCRALAQLLQPTVVRILATDQAREKHEEKLRAGLAEIGIASPNFVTIPKGVNSKERWDQFEIIKNELSTPAETSVVLDITHGFRSQPFFAAAVIAFIRAVDNGTPQLRICYGNFEERGNFGGVAPIWEVTEFVELLNWSQTLAIFLATGRAEEAADATEKLGQSLAKEWASGDRSSPRTALDKLGRAMRDFSADLETLRTGDLLIGHDKFSSAERLLRATEQAKSEVQYRTPPLAHVLNRIVDFIGPLAGPRTDLSGSHKAVVYELAELYLKFGRYVEAAATVREGWVNLYAPPAALAPGSQNFDQSARKAAERSATTADEDFRGVGDRRNDLLHAQYRCSSGTQSAKPMMDSVRGMVERLKTAEPVAPPATAKEGSFLNLSNHPGPQWEPAQAAAALALAAPLVDLPFPAVPADADEAAIEALADETVRQVPPGVTHALVQGEFTLTLALVQRLQRRRLVCLAATSERRAQTTQDGRKLSAFTFVRFRAYPPITVAE